MRKFIVIVSSIFLCTACIVHKGQWLGQQCRPKNPNFKLLKTPFKETKELLFNEIYLSNGKSFGIVFYSDGRLVYLVSEGGNNLIDQDIHRKNWVNATYIGYWRVEKDKIEIEYFVCGDFGIYRKKQGKIQGDTLFFERDCGSKPFKREICYDKYILTDMSFE